MCGITAFWAIESIPDETMIESLLKYGEMRGTDSFGYAIYNCNPFRRIFESKIIGIERKDISANNIVRYMKTGSILIANHRAIPETEELSLTDNNIQPITDPYDYTYKLVLSHNGSVSNRIISDFSLSSTFQRFTDIDSEAILFAYINNDRNMKKTMEYLSGGFAFLMLDGEKRKLYSVCTHNPLYCGYIRGLGMIFSSFKEAIYEVISLAKGTKIERQNISVWEDYYVRELPEYTITEFDIDSKLINETKFTPRYIHPNYDPYIENREQKEKVLISASGGLDSTTTLAILKTVAYDITAVHFKYGHRGGDAEELAIKNICKILNIPLIIFDITKDMKILDSNSMLTNKDHEITTGTDKDLKTTIAWTCFRNGLFTSYMGALAESFIINDKYTNVYITGGYLNLTESGVYPDNSERFINSFIAFARFASIVGTMIKPLYCCSNLLKCEQYFLLDKMGLLDKIGQWLISCDRPIVIGDRVFNCSKDGKPACGSGLLSYWSTKLAGMSDPRRYYTVDDDKYELYEHMGKLVSKDIDIYDIINKLLIPDYKKLLLMRYT